MAGYSGTPLAKKLGIKAGSRVHLIGAPPNYAELVTPLPPGVAFDAAVNRQTDLVHLFTKERSQLAALLPELLLQLRPDAVIWISWPKKASKVPTDVTENTVREVALPLGLVDVKVCAVDVTWSGLKLVLRRENR